MTFKIVTRGGEDSLEHAAREYAFSVTGHIHGLLCGLCGTGSG